MTSDKQERTEKGRTRASRSGPRGQRSRAASRHRRRPTGRTLFGPTKQVPTSRSALRNNNPVSCNHPVAKAPPLLSRGGEFPKVLPSRLCRDGFRTALQSIPPVTTIGLSLSLLCRAPFIQCVNPTHLQLQWLVVRSIFLAGGWWIMAFWDRI